LTYVPPVGLAETKDGTPATTASPVYSGPITITTDTTLGFLATDSSGNTSLVGTQVYVITAADVTAPVVSASPTGGTYVNSVDVTLSATDDTDPTPTIYYTTDGSAPTTASSVYTAPITITSDTTLGFLATDSSGNISLVSTESYAITPSTTSEIIIITVDGLGVEITGYWTVLSQGGTPLQTGFSPLTFTVNNGETYEVSMGGWAGVTFDHWEDGSTVNPRTFSITSDTTFTAFYLP